MDLFNSLPLKKQEYMNRLFRNCTEEVKYYMSVIDVEADQTYIKAGEECKYIYIILSGKVNRSRNGRCMRNLISLRTLDPGDFFGEIECFAGLPRYRKILVLNQTRARISEEVGISIKTLDRNIRKLEEMNLLTLNKGKIVITKAQYLQMKQDIDFYVNG